jgi:hypothetical protein
MRDYTKIEAWKRSDDLTVAIYERTRTFPKEEIYGLTAQLRRAAYSVPANIPINEISKFGLRNAKLSTSESFTSQFATRNW